LIEYIRERQEESGKKGYLEINKKGIGKTGENQRSVRGEQSDDRLGQHAEEPFAERQADPKSDTKSQNRSDQPRTQLFQVLQKRHSPFIFCHSYVLLKMVSARKALSRSASLNNLALFSLLGHCDYALYVGNVQTEWGSIV
jgi:hypothetical protein